MRAIGLIALCGGCFGDKAVELELAMPEPTLAAQFAPGCVTAVEVWLNGTKYPTDRDDTIRDCLTLQPSANGTWDSVHASIRGKFSGDFPDSGLGGVEVYGYAGTCDSQSNNDFDLIFFAQAAYDGGDHLTVPVIPNLSCATEDVRVRAVDVLKLLKTGQCAQAAWTRGKLALTTLSPFPFTSELYWWGGQASAAIAADGTAALRGSTKVGPKTCLAIGNYNTSWEAVGCVGPLDQRACATGAELEAPMIDPNVAKASQDLGKITRWGSLVIGAVWGTGPLAGATVTLDDASKDLGEVVYFDMPAGVETGVGSLTPRAVPSTGPSGLFGVYTQSMVTVKITTNGKTVTREIGGYGALYSQVALIKM